MKATDLKVGSVVKSNILKTDDGLGVVVECTEKQITISQKHNKVTVVDSLASGRKLHLKQSLQKISRVNFQRLMDGKVHNGVLTAEIVSL